MPQSITTQQAISSYWKMYRSHTTSVGDGFRSGNNAMPGSLGGSSGVRTGNLVTNPEYGITASINIFTWTGLSPGKQYLPLTPLISSVWIRTGNNPISKYIEQQVGFGGEASTQIAPMMAKDTGYSLYFDLAGVTANKFVVSGFDMYDRKVTYGQNSPGAFLETEGVMNRITSIYVDLQTGTSISLEGFVSSGYPYFNYNQVAGQMSYAKQGDTIGYNASAGGVPFTNFQLSATNFTTFPANRQLNPGAFPNNTALPKLTPNGVVSPINSSMGMKYQVIQINPTQAGSPAQTFNPVTSRGAMGWMPNTNDWKEWVS